MTPGLQLPYLVLSFSLGVTMSALDVTISKSNYVNLYVCTYEQRPTVKYSEILPLNHNHRPDL
jgi:hypothetical protein